jgi:hypothetical protein
VCVCVCVRACVLVLIVPRAGEVPPTCVGHALANLFLRMERTPGLRSLPMRCPDVMHFIARCQDQLPREDGHALLQQRAERQRQQDANEFLSKLLCGASSTPTLIVRRVVEITLASPWRSAGQGRGGAHEAATVQPASPTEDRGVAGRRAHAQLGRSSPCAAAR